jgi:tetratricopeptide (TPR) repeat protein
MRGWLAAITAGWAMLLSAPAAAEWREASSDHFLIYADSSEAWLRKFADRLERFDAGMRLLRNLGETEGAKSNRLTVYVVSDQAAVEKLYGQRGANIGGFYVPRAGGSIAFTPRGGYDDNFADIVLFHEYGHHFMLENYPAAYAKWFVEGFAEFHSTFAVERKDDSITFGRAAQHRAYGLLQQTPIPIETLLDPRGKKLNNTQMDVFYGRAWLLTHMLTFEKARTGQLNAYLRLINAGKPSVDAGREAFGDLKILQSDMNKYRDKRGFAGWTIPASAIKTGAITIRTLTKGEADTMPVRMRSDRGVDAKAAAALLPEARRKAAPYPADAGAQTVLAEAEYDAGNDAEAEAAADRALAANPKLRDALLYKGRAVLRRAATAKTSDPAVWKAARRWFVTANRGDPNAAEPLMLFYLSFLTAGETPTKSAAMGLERAFDLSPHDASLRILLVRQMLIDKRAKEARAILLPLANDPHANSEDNFAARVLAKIDSGIDGPDVVKAIDGEQAEARKGGKPPAPAGTGD